jgi:hypothetical protein
MFREMMIGNEQSQITGQQNRQPAVRIAFSFFLTGCGKTRSMSLRATGGSEAISFFSSENPRLLRRFAPRNDKS